jgi:hypothetical protein
MGDLENGYCPTNGHGLYGGSDRPCPWCCLEAAVARVVELEAIIKSLRSDIIIKAVDSDIIIEALRQRVVDWQSRCKKALALANFKVKQFEAAEAKLEKVRGLQRYRVEPLNPEFYERGAALFTRDPNGYAVMHSKLEALLEKPHE